MSKFTMIRLEDRILFDAAAAADIAAAESLSGTAGQPDADTNADQDHDLAAEVLGAVLEAPGAIPVPDDPAQNADVDAAARQLIEGGISGDAEASPKTSAGRHELVVINSTVPDAEKIVDAAGENGREFLVLSERNGLDELLEHLGRSDTKYDAIHFVTHGAENILSINGEQIRPENFDAAPWQELGTHLNSGADLLFYGCDIAASAEGRSLIDSIGEAAGADAAASDDATGFHGDWELEYAGGVIETAAIHVDGYEHDLASYSIDVDSYDALSGAIADAAGGAYAEYTITLGADIAWDDADPVISALFDTDLTLTLQANGDADTLTGNGLDGLLQFQIFDDAEVTVNIFGVTFSGAGENALFFAVVEGTGNLTVDGGTFLNNQAANGAAIYVNYADGTADGAVAVSNSVFDGNTADIQGGAIDIAGGALTIQKSAFYNNTAEYGGGAVMATNSTICVINSTFSANTADSSSGLGGAIHVQEGSANILNATFSGNDAAFGKAVYGNEGTVALVNSIAVSDAVGAAEICHDSASSGSFRVIASLYGAAENCTTVSSTAGVVAGDLFSDDTTTPYVIEIDNSKAAAFSGTLVGEAGSDYAYKSANGWLNVRDDSAVPAATAITEDQLSGDREKLFNDLGIAEYAVGAVAPGMLLINTVQADATLVYNGLTQSSDLSYTTAGGNAVDAAKISGAVAGSTSAKDVGEYTVVPDVSAAAVTGATGYEFKAVSGTITITPKEVTISGITAADKVYDGTTTATVDTGAATIDGMIAGDVVSVTAAGGTFDDKNVGAAKTVTISGIGLTGADAGNYSIASTGSQTTATADITAKEVTVSGITAADKVYDGTTTATVDASAATVAGVIAGDAVSVTAAGGTFGDKNVGAAKTVTISGIGLTGADAGNYSIASTGSQTTATADITAKEVTVSGITAADKVYDGTTTATVDASAATVSGMIAGDALSVTAAGGTFGDKNVGVSKTVTISGIGLTGADAGNYSIASTGSQTTATADITAKEVTISGITAADKMYDGTTTATVNTGTATINGMIAGDAVSVTAAGGTFDDKDVGVNKTVTISGIGLTGTDAGNYSIASTGSQTTATADITAKEVIISGITAADKMYDGTTTATVDTGAATIGGMIAGDAVSVTAEGGEFEDKNAGVDKTVTISGIALTGADAGNYSIASTGSQTTATADITPRHITVTSGSAGKFYDGTPLTDHTITITGDGFVTGEGFESFDVTGSQTTVGSSPNSFTYTLKNGTSAENYDIRKVYGRLTIYGIIPSRINEDTFSAGLNPNYSPTQVALANRISSVLLDNGNPFSLRYPELVSAELQWDTIDHQIRMALIGRGEAISVGADAPIPGGTELEFRFRLMERDNPMQILSGTLTSGITPVNLEGISSGQELRLDLPTPSEEGPLLEEAPVGDTADAPSAAVTVSAVSQVDLESIPVLQDNPLRKVDALKDDLEQTIETLLALA